MRVMIWGDMEGVAGIHTWDQVSGGTEAYQECRRLFTEEMNAAVRGARRAGATEVIAVDCHGAGNGWSFRSMVPDLVSDEAEWVLGYPWARYVAPLEQGVDAVLFVGAHARAGTPNGVLSHTVSSEAWYEATINDVPVGESGILAAICGCWDAPVIFASGDTATCEEVNELLGEDVVTVSVKEGLGRYACRSLSPGKAVERIERGVYDAMSRRSWPKPYRAGSPATFRVELATVDQTGVFAGRTGVEVVGPRTVEAKGENFWEAWDRFWFRSV